MSKKEVTIRPATLADIPVLAPILVEAFGDLTTRHAVPFKEFTLPDATGMLQHMIGDTKHTTSFVAEVDGKVVGSNYLSAVGEQVTAVGPISVRTDAQGGVGRKLMQAAIARADQVAHGNVRLCQDAFNMTSLSLYTQLGFDFKFHCVLLQGKPRSTLTSQAAQGVVVRKMAEADFPRLAQLSHESLGYAKMSGFGSAVAMKTGFVAERNGLLVAFTCNPAHYAFGPSIARTAEDLQALYLGASEQSDGAALMFLLPVKYVAVHRWAIAEGLRAQKTMNFMSRGFWAEPQLIYVPSVTAAP
jgi:predicted N-acetyltransferase YhbS